MPRGILIKAGELAGKLATLDVDEGIRIESAGKKMFVNRNSSGIFVVQYNSDFYYLDSIKQVKNTIKSRFGTRCDIWIY